MSAILCYTRKKAYMCSFLGATRVTDAADLRAYVAREHDLGGLFIKADLNNSGAIDTVELHQVMDSVQFNGRELDLSERKILLTFAEFKQQELPYVGLKELVLVGETYARFADRWNSKLKLLEKTPQLSKAGRYVANSSLLDLMVLLNDGQKVGAREKEWVESMSMDQADSSIALMMAIAFWYMTPKAMSADGLKRNYLIERLLIEANFQLGLVAMVSVMIMFLLVISALQLAGKTSLRREVRDNLVTMYGLDDLSSIGGSGDIYDKLKEFAGISTRAAPLSFNYLEGALELMVQEEEVSFNGPMLVAPSDLQIGANFTLQAWVSVDPEVYTDVTLGARPIPLLRRELSVESPSSCWSWMLPPSIAFGAQDFQGVDPNSVTHEREEYVGPDYPAYLSTKNRNIQSFPEFEGQQLHTIVGNQTHVRFYEGPGLLIAELPLPRMVTDCFGKRLLIGSRGMTLGSVRFFPSALTVTTVAEIYAAGAPMAEIGYSTQPAKLDGISSIDLLADQLSTSVITQEKRLTGNEQVTETASVLASAAILDPTVQPVSLNNLNVSINAPSINALLNEVASIIYTKPVHIGASSKIQAPGLSFPGMTSAGMTISFWVKPTGDPGYVFGRALPQAAGDAWTGWKDYCWYSSVGATEDTYFKIGETSGSRTVAGVHTGELPAAFKMTGRAYRHLVWRVDPANTSQYTHLCVDGVCHSEYHYYTNADGDIPRDCETLARYNATSGNDQTQLFLAGRPPVNNWPGVGWIMNAKRFPRALSDAEIATLFNGDPDPEDSLGRSVRQMRGCKLPAQIVDNEASQDDFGHDCFWYFKAGEVACKRSTWARANCPVACQSAELCFGMEMLKTSGTSQQIFTRQTDFQPVGVGGTTCVAKSTTPEAVAIECGKSIPAGSAANCTTLGVTGSCVAKDCSAFSSDKAALVACLGDTTWPITGSMPCRSIIDLNDPYCAWDDSNMQQLGQEAQTNGAWALQFWFESLSDQCMDPRIRLFDYRGALISSLSPDTGESPNKMDNADCKLRGTKFYASMGLTADTRKPLERGAVLYTSPTMPGERHVMAFGMKAVTKAADGTYSGTMGIQFDSQTNYNANVGASEITGMNFLKVINIAGPIRLSPIKMTSEFPSASEMSSVRSRQLEFQAVKTGPSKEPRFQAKNDAPRSQIPFLLKSALVSPPLLIQKRFAPGECKIPLSSKVVDDLFKLASDMSCNYPYSCSGWDKANVYQCKAGDETGPFFGMAPCQHDGDLVHIEYLSSIVDHQYLLRHQNGAATMLPTRSFIDTLTAQIQMQAIFYSIEFGVITEMTVQFDTSGGKVNTNTYFEHYVALTGDMLTEFQLLEALVVVSAIGWLLVQVQSARVARAEYHLRKKWVTGATIVVIDIVILTLLMALIVVSWTDVANSEKVSTRIVSRLTGMGWERDDRTYMQKRDDFLAIMRDLNTVQAYSASLGNYGMFISVLLLGRMVYSTSAHPRIASVTSTFKHAFDLLAHFVMVFLLIFGGFAFIATWRFGHEKAFLANFSTACKSQFDSMLDPPGEMGLATIGEHETDFLIYACLFHVMCLFFLMNFILAIIVDSYTKSQQQLEASPCEQSMMMDTGSLGKTFLKGLGHSWPNRRIIVHYLQNTRIKYVKPIDLLQCGFKSQEDATAFCKFYARFEFLHGRDLPETQKEEKENQADALAKIDYKMAQVCQKMNVGGGRRGLSEMKMNVSEGSTRSGNVDEATGEICVELVESKELDYELANGKANGKANGVANGKHEAMDIRFLDGDWLMPNGTKAAVFESSCTFGSTGKYTPVEHSSHNRIIVDGWRLVAYTSSELQWKHDERGLATWYRFPGKWQESVTDLLPGEIVQIKTGFLSADRSVNIFLAPGLIGQVVEKDEKTGDFLVEWSELGQATATKRKMQNKRCLQVRRLVGGYEVPTICMG